MRIILFFCALIALGWYLTERDLHPASPKAETKQAEVVTDLCTSRAIQQWIDYASSGVDIASRAAAAQVSEENIANTFG